MGGLHEIKNRKNMRREMGKKLKKREGENERKSNFKKIYVRLIIIVRKKNPT